MKSAEVPASKASKGASSTKSGSATRDKLLSAAIQIIITQGIERLTLDAVARSSSVSKGGLLYHFPSKEALVAGVITYLIDDFNAAIERELEHSRTDNPSKDWIKAYVRASFNASQPPLALIAGLFIAVTDNPELVEHARAGCAEWQRHFDESGLERVHAGIIRLATEGLYPIEMFGVEPIKEPLRSQLKDGILKLIDSPN
jgi:AcrR family transcriptional regulator